MSSLSSLSLLLVCLSLSMAPDSYEARRRPVEQVTNGVLVKAHEYPFMVHIDVWSKNYWSMHAYCDGTVIDRWHVLTSTKCVLQNPTNASDFELVDPGRIFIRYSCNDLHACSWAISYFQVTKVRAYKPENKKATLDHDIAILDTYSEIEFNKNLTKGPLVYSIFTDCELPSECELIKPEQLTHVSFGDTGPLNPADKTYKKNHLMRKNLLKINSDKECKEAWPNYDPERMICAGDEKNQACVNDWGAPLMRKLFHGDFLQEGIFSSGFPNCSHPRGSLYTRISYYRRWIIGCLKDNPACCEAVTAVNETIWPIYRHKEQSSN